MHNNAQQFWKEFQTQNKLVLLNGTLHNSIVDLNELLIEYNGNIPYFMEHYIPEKQLIETSKTINLDNIENIDFIILDGGEYSTQGDYDVLIQKKPKYIALDDVNVYKCKKIRQSLLNNKDWVLYQEKLYERNGWSIFERK
jgi:hypothetical protein